MSQIKKSISILLFSMYLLVVTQHVDSQEFKGYTSWLPAPKADQAMLLGNGTMGAMVFGHPHTETIIINHSSLYLPTGLPKQPIDQYSRLSEIRKLILEGNGTDAAKIPVEQSLKEGYSKQIWSDPYIPAFDLKINISPENISKYKRSLNFETGEAIVIWEQAGNQFSRKQFISRADSVLIIKISATTPFNAELSFNQRPVNWDQWGYINENIKSTEIYNLDNTLHYKSEFNYQWEGNIAGYEGVGKLLKTDGKIAKEGNTLVLQNAKEVLFAVKVESHKTNSSFNTDEILQNLLKISTEYEVLLNRHKAIHTELFNRISIQLNGSEEDLSLDAEIMMQQAKDRFSPSFVQKQFYAARYNILSATGSTPPNLQGIWGSSWQPPWASDYTHDGNLPTAISSFLCSSMPELMLSFFDYHDARIHYYQDNSKRLYGCRGIQVPSHSSSHGWNVHFDTTWCLTFWNGGAAWASHFYYDYWLYTGDIEFLKNRAYPFMKETALFYEDFLSLGEDNKYVFNPSYSPENNPKNNPSQATVNATMDVSLAKELLRNLIEVGKTLKENENQVNVWQTMLSKLPDYKTDSSGVFKEWLWPDYKENHHHRHISQLYGMYDIVDPEIASDSNLWKGVENAVQERMKVRRQDNGGIMVFGMVQMAWVAENLRNAELVQDILSWLSAQYWSNSLATYHDPNGLFNMDLSGGFQSAVIRSLISSEPENISILPAKPPKWKTGSLNGVSLRNQITAKELNWTEKRITIVLLSQIDQKTELILPENSVGIELSGKNGKIAQYNKEKNIASIEIPSNKPVEIIINLVNKEK